MAKVFLGGTVNRSNWRDYVIPRLKIDYFNPVVEEWNEKAYQLELYERKACDFCLYVLTPKMSGVYAVAEVIDDSNKRPDKTILCILYEDGQDQFTSFQTKSMKAVGKMVQQNGGRWLQSLDELISYLNQYAEFQLHVT